MAAIQRLQLPKIRSLASLIRERGILGCVCTHRLPTIAMWRRLLEAAYGAGFRQFDVAPAYRNGLAERAVAPPHNQRCSMILPDNYLDKYRRSRPKDSLL